MVISVRNRLWCALWAVSMISSSSSIWYTPKSELQSLFNNGAVTNDIVSSIACLLKCQVQEQPCDVAGILANALGHSVSGPCIVNKEQLKKLKSLKAGIKQSMIVLRTLGLTDCELKKHACHENATCIPISSGSYQCTCNAGYSGDGKFCDFIASSEDDDDSLITDATDCCESNDCHVNASCECLAGTYDCACVEGFSGDGYSNCDSINECVSNPCGSNAACIDTFGSYNCICEIGFTGSYPTCTNINECSLSMDYCDGNATCVDNEGSYACECNQGFTGDGTSCVPLGHCAANTHTCHPMANCTESGNSFNCTCKDGLIGDGQNCRYDFELDFQASESAALVIERDVGTHDGLTVCYQSYGEQDGTPVTIAYKPDFMECAASTTIFRANELYVRRRNIEKRISVANLLNTWAHVCVTWKSGFSGGTQKIYINGSVVNITTGNHYTWTNPVQATVIMIVLGNSMRRSIENPSECTAENGLNPFVGKIKDVFVLGTTLSDSQIKQVYSGSYIPDDTLFISWDIIRRIVTG